VQAGASPLALPLVRSARKEAFIMSGHRRKSWPRRHKIPAALITAAGLFALSGIIALIAAAMPQ